MVAGIKYQLLNTFYKLLQISKVKDIKKIEDLKEVIVKQYPEYRQQLEIEVEHFKGLPEGVVI